MTRGARSGRSTRPYAGAGPDQARDRLSLPAPPVPDFFLPICFCPGRICLRCGHVITRWGCRLGSRWVSAYAHPRCAEAVVVEMPELAPTSLASTSGGERR